MLSSMVGEAQEKAQEKVGSSKLTLRVLIGVYLASFIIQAMNVISLMFHGLSVAYPDASVQQIQLLMTCMNIFAIFGMLIAGRMATYFTKKAILIAMMVLLGIGGLIGYFSTSLSMVYVSAAVIGLADGSFIPLAAALIAEYLSGTKRAAAMGVQGIFVNGGAVILNLAGGFLAAMLWKNVYFIYFAALPMAIILLILLPKGGNKEVVEKGEKAPVFTKFQVAMMLQCFFVGLTMMTLLANLTMFVFEMGIGNEVQAGIIQSCFTLGAVILGAILIVPMMKLFRRYLWAVAILCGAVGLWIFSFTGSFVPSIIGAFLIGACFSMHNTAYFSIAPDNTHPARNALSMSLFSTCLNIGMIVSPILITSIAFGFSESASMRFMVCAIIISVAAILAFIAPKTLYKDSKLILDSKK